MRLSRATLLPALLSPFTLAQTTTTTPSQNTSQSPTATSYSCPVSPSPGYLFPYLPVNPTTPGSCYDNLQNSTAANSPPAAERNQTYEACVKKCNTQRDFCSANYSRNCQQTYYECLGFSLGPGAGCSVSTYDSLVISAEIAAGHTVFTETDVFAGTTTTRTTTLSLEMSGAGMSGSSGGSTTTAAETSSDPSSATTSSSPPSATPAATGSQGVRAAVSHDLAFSLFLVFIVGTAAFSL